MDARLPTGNPLWTLHPPEERRSRTRYSTQIGTVLPHAPYILTHITPYTHKASLPTLTRAISLSLFPHSTHTEYVFIHSYRYARLSRSSRLSRSQGSGISGGGLSDRDLACCKIPVRVVISEWELSTEQDPISLFFLNYYFSTWARSMSQL